MAILQASGPLRHSHIWRLGIPDCRLRSKTSGWEKKDLEVTPFHVEFVFALVLPLLG